MTIEKPQDSAAPMCAASALSAGLGAKVGDGDTAAVGHDGKAWPQTMDAKVWADEFCKRNSASDHGTMLGWFANAIMIGHDTARWQCENEQTQCCGDFENCRTPCVPRAEHWKSLAKTETPND